MFCSFRVIECSDLPVTNGSCNPYAVVTINYGKIKNREEVKRTNVKKKTICPQFEETFFFDVRIIENKLFMFSQTMEMIQSNSSLFISSYTAGYYGFTLDVHVSVCPSVCPFFVSRL